MSRSRSRSVSSDSDDDDEAGPSTARNGYSSSSKRQKKKPRASQLEDIFTKQTAEEHKKLTGQYRSLLTAADDLSSNVVNASTEQLESQIRRSGKVFSHVKDTGIAALDARVFQTTTDTALALARKLTMDANAFDINDFLLRIKSLLGLDRPEIHDMDGDEDEDVDELDGSSDVEEGVRENGGAGARGRGARRGVLGDWEKLGWMAAGYCRRVPGLEIMYGPLSVDYQKRTVAQRAKKRALAPEERPHEIESTQKKEAHVDETVAGVRSVAKVLYQHDPERLGVNMLKLVINPESFGQSVENMFFVAFLANDGRVGIDVKDDGEIVIRTTDPADEDQQRHSMKHQAVLELDMETWEEAKKIFDITESMIPHRPPKDGNIATQGKRRR